MRFPLIVTTVAAIAAAPLVAAASGPRMSADDFIGAARCAAYDTVSGAAAENPDLLRIRAQLNSEARHQSPETIARARAEILAVGERAAEGEAAMLRQERTAACAAGAMIARGDAAPAT